MKYVLSLLLILGVAAPFNAEVDPQEAARTVDEYKRLGKQVIAPKILKQIEPEYPERLRKKKLVGKVVIVFVVDENGVPKNPKVKESSHREFDSIALKTINQWRFIPGQVEGNVAPIVTDVEFNFMVY